MTPALLPMAQPPVISLPPVVQMYPQIDQMKEEWQQQSDFLFEALVWLAASNKCKNVPLIIVSLFKQSTLQLCASCVSWRLSAFAFFRCSGTPLVLGREMKRGSPMPYALSVDSSEISRSD